MEYRVIPKEILSIIPKYDGDEQQLNLYLSKCDYVVNGSRIAGNLAQELYIFHSITSRLTGRAATLLSDHPNITTYEALKELLTQHFGDPRSEECIAIELETLKLKTGETYIQFCHRIQSVKSSLFAKVHRLTDEGIKAAKMIVYNNTALNVFLYNLPEDMIRIVRLKGAPSLEAALSIVTEEVNFKFQYDTKNKLLKQASVQLPSMSSHAMPKPFSAPPVFRQNINQTPMPTFKFGIPQNQGFRPNLPQQPRFMPPMQNLHKYGQQQGLPQRNFGQTPPQRAPFQYGGYKFGIPQQQNFKFGIPNQHHSNANQFKFGIPNQQIQPPRLQESDVTMRTAPARQNLMVNELFYDEPSQEQAEYDYGYGYEENVGYAMNDCNYTENINEFDYSYPVIENGCNNSDTNTNAENFQATASPNVVK